MKLTRRNFLSGTATAAAIAITGKPILLNVERNAGRPAASGNPLRIPKEIPGGDLTIAQTTAQIFPGIETTVLSANAEFPTPTIRVHKGDTFSANVINALQSDVVLHWHGQHAPADMDGHPSQAIKPGGSAQIAFPMINRAGTYFYHSHTDKKTAEQVYRGLSGLFIVDDEEDAALPFPRGEFDIPMMLTDKRFDANHQLVYAPTDDDHRTGYVGETIMVNSTPDAYLEVAPTLYRLRILNGSNARIYQLALDDDSSFTIIASDGGLLAAPITTKSCYLSPSERIEIVIDFSKYQLGGSLKLKSLPFFHDGPQYTPLPQGGEFDIIRFDITKTGDSNASIPAALSTIVPYKQADAKRPRSFELGTDGLMHTINGLSFDMDRVDASVPFGELEQWTFSNALTTEYHPMHVHATQFQVLSRSGGELMPSDQGWKDTVMVRPGELVDVLITFVDYPTGVYLVHCHNLEHEDHGMMSNFQIVFATGVTAEDVTSAALSVNPNPADKYATVTIPKLLSTSATTIQLCDSAGRIVLTQPIERGTTSEQLTLSKIPNGDYFVQCGAVVAKLTVLH